MRAILVLGKQPKKDGSTKELETRVAKAIQLWEKEKRFNCIIISGGETRPGLPAEALIGANYARDKLGSGAKILLESRSRSTADNILFVKDIIGKSPLEELIVVTSSPHDKRVRYLFGRLWPGVVSKLSFVSSGRMSAVERFTELILRVLAVLDPREKFILPIFKKMMRNG